MDRAKELAGMTWRRFRAWPIVAQIVVGTFFGLFAVGAAAAPFTEEPEDEPAAVEEELPRETTTTAERTTTTEERTTTTPPPTTATTAAPTTTAPPPPPPPPTTAAPASNCTPGYDPCVPQASDVDCAGGSGNGPEYVSGPVRVTGSDPYGLDADGDGLGCED
jgi:hypothetical protein